MYLNAVPFQVLIDDAIDKGGLSASAIAQILKFRVFGDQEGFLLLKNQNIGDIPKTPSELKKLVKQSYESERLILQATTLLGEAIGYPQESDGSLINNFFPQAAKATALSSDSFDTELDLHSENAFHNVPPDYLTLLCLRQAPNKDAITYISSVDKILPHLDGETIEFFFNEPYLFLSDYCHSEKNCRIDTGQRKPVLYGMKSSPYIRFDPQFMIARSAYAQRMITHLTEIAWSVATPVSLETGDLLIMDNRKTAHARSPFNAQLDGNDRWIQRTFAISHKRQLVAATGESSNVIRLETMQ